MADSQTTNFIEPGFADEGIKSAIKLIGTNSVIHGRQEGIWRTIQTLFENSFTISNPTGNKKISSKMLLQVLFKVANKMKIPDFKIYRAGPFALHNNLKALQKDTMIREQVEAVVTAGVATVMKEGKFTDCFRNKGGAFYKMALFGDCFIHVGCDDKSDYPIQFRVGSLSDVYMNNSACDIRDAVGGLSCDEMVVIYRYSMLQFNELFPDMKGKVAKGDIPRAYRYRKQLEKTWLQTTYTDDDMVEVAYAYSIEKRLTIFAGAACTLVDKFEGDDEQDSETSNPTEEVDETKSTGKKPYSSIMDGKPYIPILHMKFFPSSEGFYNYGFAHMIFDLAVLCASMDNMAYSHASQNIFPITFVNTPNKNASKLFNEILKAHEMQTAGGSGYVVSENPQGQGSGVTVESFQSQPITQEWERAFTRLEKNVERLGFNLDQPDLGANPNEMSILQNQESQDLPIKQVIEWNASEFEFAVNITMDAIRKFIPDDDQTPLNSMVDLESGQDAKIPMRSFSLGMVATELRNNKYFVVVNSRDGTVPSGVMQQAQLTKAMSTLAPGSPAWNKLSIKQAKLNGQDITMADLQAPAPTGNPALPTGAAAGPVQTETSPLTAATLKHPQLNQ